MDDDIVFLDDEMRLCGYAVGMSQEEQKEFCARYHLHVDIYKHFEKYWKDEK